MTAVAALPASLVIALAVLALQGGEGSRFPCPLYPDASVSLGSALHGGCTLAYGDRIHAIETGDGLRVVESAGDLRAIVHESARSDWRLRLSPDPGSWAVVSALQRGPLEVSAGFMAALVLCGWLVAIVRLTAIRARVPAAWPFGTAYGAVGALIAAALVGWSAPGTYPIASLARATLAAALIDLALIFPRVRVTRAWPRMLPYLACGLLWLAEIHAAYQDRPTTMLLIQKLLAAALAAAGGLLLLSCAVASRTSPSSIERRQARGFLQGLVGLVGVTALFAILDGPGGVGSAATVGAALSPLPLGYAIARHHLFDLDLDVRRAAAQLVSSMTMAALLFLPLYVSREVLNLPAPLRPAPLLFAAVFCTVVPLDLLRRGVAGWVESALRPRAIAWEELARTPEIVQLSGARDPEGTAKVASGLLARGFPDTDNAIFLAQGEELVVAHATGHAACADSRAAALAHAFLPDRPTDLNRLALDHAGEMLYEMGVEASSPIRRRDDLLGWILISPRTRGMFLSSGHLGFLASIASQTAAALHHLHLTETLLVTERFAAQGRVHAELAHELGKPLGTLEILAHKLARGQAHETAEASRTAASIARLASQLRGIVRGVLVEPGPALETHHVTAGALMAQAQREVADVRGEGRVVVHPTVRAMHLPASHRRLVRVLTNLLNNGIDASAPGQIVDLRVHTRLGEVVFEVIDSGEGIAEDRIARVMDPFVTSREGGTGLGLAIAREIVEALGGRLVLSSIHGQGTSARIHLSDERCSEPETR